jgi:transposase
LKREIVAATYEPGASVAGVARRYGVNDNQVFAWRKRLGPPGVGASAHMVPVVVTEDMTATGREEPSSAGVVEIDLAGGYRVRVGDGVGAKLLCRILDVLERR